MAYRACLLFPSQAGKLLQRGPSSKLCWGTQIKIITLICRHFNFKIGVIPLKFSETRLDLIKKDRKDD